MFGFFLIACFLVGHFYLDENIFVFLRKVFWEVEFSRLIHCDLNDCFLTESRTYVLLYRIIYFCAVVNTIKRA